MCIELSGEQQRVKVKVTHIHDENMSNNSSMTVLV